ncbi:MAG: hypothetical protein MUE85_14315 [Microscillaceae bacterium]|jgi:hypothetical protein|nr:hypothetical protein [Microscillaceae bacterium]
MIIFESPFLRVEYNEELQTILEEWKLDFTTKVEGEVFRQPLEVLLQEFKNRQISKWLCDNTEQKPIASTDQLWLEEYYYPNLIKAGLQKVALVNAKNILGTSSAKNLLQGLVGHQLTIEVFNKNKEAKNWLKTA